MTYAFPAPPPVAALVEDGGLFPVRRIFCVGRNYADHVKEMFGDPKSSSPVFFTKPADALMRSGTTIAFPSVTQNLHYEGELVIALQSGGRNIAGAAAAMAMIFGWAVGCDLTRRDLQAAAKKAGEPWDAAKGFDQSAPVGTIGRVEDHPPEAMMRQSIRLSVNGQVRQDGPLKDMIFSPAEIILHLSRLFELRAGDLIFTGTPQGVGPLTIGDRVEATIGALPPLNFAIGPSAK
jgi:fumarylpyruvate hydrolase